MREMKSPKIDRSSSTRAETLQRAADHDPSARSWVFGKPAKVLNYRTINSKWIA